MLMDVNAPGASGHWFDQSVYLGGTAPSTLVCAGHIRAHHEAAAPLADALFRTERPPHCLHWF